MGYTEPLEYNIQNVEKYAMSNPNSSNIIPS